MAEADDSLPRELCASLREALLCRGIRSLTAVQSRALDAVREGRDASLCSPTGSGKTLAYALPLAAAHVARGGGDAGGIAVMVVLPTRELAAQVHAAAGVAVAAAGVRCVLCAGGAPLPQQEAALRDAAAPPHWAIGTPGRLRDLAERGALRLETLRTQARKHLVLPCSASKRLTSTLYQVLDEADRLLDEGMVDEVMPLLRLGGVCQTVLASATWPPGVARLATHLLRADALHVRVAGQGGGGVGGGVRHLALLCPRAALASTLVAACDAYARGGAAPGARGAALAFTDTRDAAAALADACAAAAAACRPADPLRVACLHGALPQPERDAALAALRRGDTDLLVATDVAARGLDIPAVELVAHAAPPGDAAAYTHRAGRAGRPGSASPGVSLLLYRPEGEEGRALADLERGAGVAFRRIASIDDDAEQARAASMAPPTARQDPAKRAAAAQDGARLLVTDRLAMLTADLAELGAKGKARKGKR
jgi:superfamily II DNA/RNA helicase